MPPAIASAARAARRVALPEVPGGRRHEETRDGTRCGSEEGRARTGHPVRRQAGRALRQKLPQWINGLTKVGDIVLKQDKVADFDGILADIAAYPFDPKEIELCLVTITWLKNFHCNWVNEVSKNVKMIDNIFMLLAGPMGNKDLKTAIKAVKKKYGESMTQDCEKWDTLDGKFEKWKQVLEGGR